jgi:hypothetical protein
LRERGSGFVDLRPADALGPIQDLALEIGEIDAVRIGDRQPAEAACGEVEGRRAPQPAGTDDQRARLPQPLLPLDADLG